MDETFDIILDAAGRGVPLRAEQLRKFFPPPGRGRGGLLDLMAAAGLAAARGGSHPFTCGIVNAKSGLCQENCAFCAQSARHAAAVPVHPLVSSDAMLARAEQMAGDGITYMGMVTSGTGPTPADFDRLCRMAERITREVGIKLCASLGILGAGQAAALAAAGFASYHHNLETARSHYPSVCDSHAYDLRVATVRHAKQAGLRVCSGGIFGVGESWEQRFELSGEFADLDVDSIPVNFLTPIPGTPLADKPRPPPEEALAVLAMLRLMHPGRDIVVCGGRACLGPFQSLLFPAGANGLMVGDYLTTRGESPEADFALMKTLGLRA